MASQYKWGFDLGGTKIEAVILDSLDNNKIIERQRVPTLSSEGYDTVINQVKTLLNIMRDKSGLDTNEIGIGTPGRLDPESQTMKNSNSTCLNGQPLLDDLKDRLALDVKIENDANCFALSEAIYYTSNGYKNAQVIFGVIMGTGVGGGIVVNGKVIGGLHGIGGEWGHNHLDDSGGDCYCGKVGCVEKVIAGPALEKYFASISSTSKSLKDINQMAIDNTDAHAVQTIDRLHQMFGKGIAPILNFLDPDIVILGGGVGNIDSLYTEGVEAIKPYHFNTHLKTRFLKPHFGDSSGVIGAALL